GGASKEYQGKDIRKFIKNVSEYNGVTLDKADRVLNLYMDKEGNYISKQDPSFIKNSAKIEAQREMESIQKTAKISASADQFQSTGNLGDLKPAIGARTNEGSIILDIKKKRFNLIGKAFSIIIQTGDKTEPIEFSTQDEVAQYIKEHTKPNK
ncbi:MAG: hypothetical protein WKF91_03200, partial [Segetibacter sp.]